MRINNLFKSKKGIAKSIALVGILAMFIGFAVLVYAQTPQELQDELNQLESDLSSAGYNWLIDYNGTVDNVFFEKLNKILGVKNEQGRV